MKKKKKLNIKHIANIALLCVTVHVLFLPVLTLFFVAVFLIFCIPGMRPKAPNPKRFTYKDAEETLEQTYEVDFEFLYKENDPEGGADIFYFRPDVENSPIVRAQYQEKDEVADFASMPLMPATYVILVDNLEKSIIYRVAEECGVLKMNIDGIPPGIVSKRVQAAMDKMREELEKYNIYVNNYSRAFRAELTYGGKSGEVYFYAYDLGTIDHVINEFRREHSPISVN